MGRTTAEIWLSHYKTVEKYQNSCERPRRKHEPSMIYIEKKPCRKLIKTFYLKFINGATLCLFFLKAQLMKMNLVLRLPAVFFSH